MKYRVHKFSIRMSQDQDQLEQFLNTLKGEIIAIIPNTTFGPMFVPEVDFLLIVERIEE